MFSSENGVLSYKIQGLRRIHSLGTFLQLIGAIDGETNPAEDSYNDFTDSNGGITLLTGEARCRLKGECTFDFLSTE